MRGSSWLRDLRTELGWLGHSPGRLRLRHSSRSGLGGLGGKPLGLGKLLGGSRPRLGGELLLGGSRSGLGNKLLRLDKLLLRLLLTKCLGQLEVILDRARRLGLGHSLELLRLRLSQHRGLSLRQSLGIGLLLRIEHKLLLLSLRLLRLSLLLGGDGHCASR